MYYCNTFLNGNQIKAARGVENKWGKGTVDELEARMHITTKLTRTDYASGVLEAKNEREEKMRTDFGSFYCILLCVSVLPSGGTEPAEYFPRQSVPAFQITDAFISSDKTLRLVINMGFLASQHGSKKTKFFHELTHSSNRASGEVGRGGLERREDSAASVEDTPNLANQFLQMCCYETSERSISPQSCVLSKE